MNFENIDTLAGSPESKDLFEPHMPNVDLLSDMSGYFSYVWNMLNGKNTNKPIENKDSHKHIDPDSLSFESPNERRYIAIVTPGRMITFFPTPPLNSRSEKELAPIKAVLPYDEPQQITAISYTKLEAYLADETKMKCIPFLHYLVAFAYLGHNVMVFEGHSSALEFGVNNSDVLMIDSGMLPFLDSEWPKTALKYMNPDPKIFIYNRESSEFNRVAKKSSSPGWQYTERDGETSYTNMLLTTMAKENDNTKIVDILSGSPLPDLKNLTTNIDQLDYISTLPYRYDKLDADEIIKIIWENGSPDNFLDKMQSKRTFRVMLAESEGKTRDVSFRLKLSKANSGKSHLKIQLL